MKHKLITKATLKEWDACASGFKRFVELFPDGADLKTASLGLIDDGHADWSDWLWDKCVSSDDEAFRLQTVATAGDWGAATAGYMGTATAGDMGTAAAGYRGTATAGYRGTATAGDGGTATAGYRGTATAGYMGTATAGDMGTAAAGDMGTAAAGYRGTATAGDGGTATAGYRGTATAGDGGTLIVKYWDKDAERYRIVVGYIGEAGLKPNVKYKLDDNHQFIEVE